MKRRAKNRVSEYEAGWLTLLVQMGVATETEAREAMCRVAQQAVDEMNARRAKRKADRDRRRGETD